MTKKYSLTDKTILITSGIMITGIVTVVAIVGSIFHYTSQVNRVNELEAELNTVSSQLEKITQIYGPEERDIIGNSTPDLFYRIKGDIAYVEIDGLRVYKHFD